MTSKTFCQFTAKVYVYTVTQFAALHLLHVRVYTSHLYSWLACSMACQLSGNPWTIYKVYTVYTCVDHCHAMVVLLDVHVGLPDLHQMHTFS
jgi:hypothetical protein